MNLPTNQPLSYQDRARSAMAFEPLHTYYQTNIPVSYLPPGTNVLAVEVHKYTPTITTLSFDLELFGMGDFPPPTPPLLSLWTARIRSCVGRPPTVPALFSFTTRVLIPSNPYPGFHWEVPTCSPTGSTSAGTNPITYPPSTGWFTLACRQRVRGWAFAWIQPPRVPSWDSGFAGFNLETATGLSGTGTWQTVSSPYTLSNATFQAQSPATGSSNAFFRLRKPVQP